MFSTTLHHCCFCYLYWNLLRPSGRCPNCPAWAWRKMQWHWASARACIQMLPLTSGLKMLYSVTAHVRLCHPTPTTVWQKQGNGCGMVFLCCSLHTPAQLWLVSHILLRVSGIFNTVLVSKSRGRITSACCFVTQDKKSIIRWKNLTAAPAQRSHRSNTVSLFLPAL